MLEKQGDDRSLEEIETMTSGSLRRAVQEGDFAEGTFMSGQIAGLLNEPTTCAAILDKLVGGAQAILADRATRFGKEG